MLEQHNFGSGTLFLVRTDVALPTPVRVGTLQEVSVDMSFSVKELYGQNQAPVAVARAQQKITGKVKSGSLNTRQLGDTFFGQSVSTGEQITVVDEGGPNGTAIPATPFQIVVANGATMSSATPGIDFGVFNAGTGIQMTRVASAPTAGQYSCDMTTGTYTFSSADHTAGVQVVISYAYFETTTGNRITAFNQLMGSSPTFRMQLGEGYAGTNGTLTLYAAIPTKISWNFKNEDFTIPEFEFSAFADSLGRYFDWSGTL
ncbi:MAG: hypothetical protein KGI37_06650 [Alphaproteobacteria bacterium]|nr:hypothetical protein [Alphaproteobacteria bacterium]